MAASSIPARYSTISVRSARGPVREAVVTAYNYCFERCDGVYVDYPGGDVNQLVWLHQIVQA
jgi:hypothetical protein